MNLTGFLIPILTFPGVIVHEFAHKIFCNLTNVKVKEVKYFRLGNPAGYVIHEAPSTFGQTFMITVGPLIVNTVFALIALFLSRMMIDMGFVFAILLWLGVSIAMHAFPSTGDAKSLWSESKRHLKNNLLALIGFPIAAIIWVASILRIVWFDLIYASFLVVVVNSFFVV